MRAEDGGSGEVEWLINKYLQCDHDPIAGIYPSHEISGARGGSGQI